MNTQNIPDISLAEIAQAVSAASAIDAASKVEEALQVSSDTLFQLVAVPLTQQLVDAAETALGNLELLEAQSGGTQYSDAVEINRQVFDMRMNGATTQEIDEYLEAIEIKFH